MSPTGFQTWIGKGPRKGVFAEKKHNPGKSATIKEKGGTEQIKGARNPFSPKSKFLFFSPKTGVPKI